MKETEELVKRMEEIYSYIKDETSVANESIITILGKNFHDEDIISNYLAYILDPYSNGIGHQPLHHLLELLNIPHEPEDLENVDIQREYLLPNRRRIDFLITLNNEHVIAIEHKVFSGEHGNQTIDYECELKKLYNSIENEAEDTKITYVFLTPAGKDPLNCNFIPVRYSQLVELLRKIPVDFTKDVRKAVLFHEFISHLEGYFLNNQKLELSKKSTLYLDHLETIKDLEHQFENDYTNVFQYIETIVKNHFIANVEGDWKFDFNQNRTYHKIFKPHWKTENLDIHFELSLSKEGLSKQQLTFRLDIEGSNKNDFEVKRGDYLQKNIQKKLASNSISFKKNYKETWKNKFAFAKKTYHILAPEYLTNETKLKSSLEEMIGEFEEFIKPIDKEIAAYNNPKEYIKE
ncbi:PD-(D/E)XK nuclease family protein [Salimicrobium flavidum]|uniref:PD-(D/E)XK nuclease superfamily protein n=1 Tax=Salimicrobium flavidum TaxID=570947 RepID=A0A1N7K2A5_9BACI|nr:PD-(D/E)XK nuclease family protein [Salimicrobium flavidum]SIS55564.1 PD-(D/E)XK nuclease superfamily protein [Salimicrobium flavidum]